MTDNFVLPGFDLQDKLPSQNPQFQLEVMDEEHLLYNPLLTKTIYLNTSAAVVWQLCNGRNTIREIIEMLENKHPEAGSQIKTDVVRSIDELVSHQALLLL